jgi:KaiC/GvpD/RAD55 family RecA-like ATPase
VRFYQDRVSLSHIVADFIGDGLSAGHSAVVIATAEHRAAISEQLQARGFDLPRVEAQQRLFVLDAVELLQQFLVEGMPDAERFTAVIVPILEKASAANGRGPTRAYGEMVDVLWKSGQTVAAIRLEMLWNHLAHSYDFELLCGYAMGNFYKDTAVEAICRQHTHAVSEHGELGRVDVAETFTGPDTSK